MERELEIGLIVPVLDDARALERLLEWCTTERIPMSEIWVVDGGSSDDSMKIAHHFGANAISAQPPRAAQLNEGARAARAAGCDVLWFVHADAFPPSGAIVKIANAIGGAAVGGAFRRRFELRSWVLRATCILADWRGAVCGWFLGDQAIFATVDAFAHVGGFPLWPWFEDLEFARRLRRTGRTVLIRSTLKTSGRRFERPGPFRRTLIDAVLMMRYRLVGMPPFPGAAKQSSRRSAVSSAEHENATWRPL